MNTKKIKDAAHEIETCQKALGWLESCGSNLNEDDCYDLLVSFNTSLGSMLEGHKQAMGVLQKTTCLQYMDILERAIWECNNTIKVSIAVIDAEISGTEPVKAPSGP
jgi:hypothetical protein